MWMPKGSAAALPRAFLETSSQSGPRSVHSVVMHFSYRKPRTDSPPAAVTLNPIKALTVRAPAFHSPSQVENSSDR